MSSKDYMNKTDKKRFHKLLIKWKNEIHDEARDAITIGADNLADVSDRASQEEEINLELHTINRKSHLMTDISEALQSLDENNYGYCNECRTEIGIKRLEVNPIANQCVDCQELAEVKERNYIH